MGAKPRRRIAVPGVVLTMAVLAAPTTATAQAGARGASDGPGTHVLIGALGGRLDLRGAPGIDVLGARAGVAFGDRVQLTGFYWQSIDTDDREFLDDRGWGGEVQVNLLTRLTVTPFATGGVARIRLVDDEYRTAGTFGGGLALPFGPVHLRATATDYVFGLSAFDDEAEESTHNWLFSAGLTVPLGRRSRAPVIIARPPRPAEPVVVRAAADPAPADPAVVDVPYDYQSDRRIELPIPLQGSITIRYGPEPASRVQVVPGAPPLAAVERRTAEDLPPHAAAVFQDPAVQAWLRDVVSAQVAERLARDPARGIAAEPTERLVQRIMDATIATLLPQLEAAEARRVNLLRDDLRQALVFQREIVRDEVERLEARLRGERPPEPRPLEWPRPLPPADPPVAAAPVQPTPEPPPAAPAEPAMPPAPLTPQRHDAELRVTLAELASRHLPLLTAAETERGPAIVIGDTAFETGSALVDGQARAVIREVAGAIAGEPDRFIFVQGHTDSVGPELANQRLSELRAETVRSLLVQGGVDPGRVYAIGYGEARPVASNDTVAGRASNRRVEIVVGPSPIHTARGDDR